MGDRDHSTECPDCGLQRGGINDLECDCDHALTSRSELEAEVARLNVEILKLKSELALERGRVEGMLLALHGRPRAPAP